MREKASLAGKSDNVFVTRGNASIGRPHISKHNLFLKEIVAS